MVSLENIRVVSGMDAVARIVTENEAMSRNRGFLAREDV